MKYYAVPSSVIFTIDQSTNQFRQGIFNPPKVTQINMSKIIDTLNHSESLQLFKSETDAIAYIESHVEHDTMTGFERIGSPPLLQVEFNSDIETGRNGKSFKPSDVTLISGKMIFVGRKKVFDLPYRSVSDLTNITISDKFFSSEFDIRMLPIVFAVGATLGWMIDSYTINHEKTGAAAITGFIAIALYFKWCNLNVATREEKDTNIEIQRLRRS